MLIEVLGVTPASDKCRVESVCRAVEFHPRSAEQYYA